jgi:hypothetical protein
MLLVHAGLAYVISAEAPGSVKALFELTLVSTPLVAPFLAVLPATVAWSLRDGHDAPRWFVWASAAAAVVIAVPSFGFADRGVLSPDVGQQLVFNGLTLWLLACGIAWPARRAASPRPAVAALA